MLNLARHENHSDKRSVQLALKPTEMAPIRLNSGKVQNNYGESGQTLVSSAINPGIAANPIAINCIYLGKVFRQFVYSGDN